MWREKFEKLINYRFLLILILVPAIFACGQKGPLYLPDGIKTKAVDIESVDNTDLKKKKKTTLKEIRQ